MEDFIPVEFEDQQGSENKESLCNAGDPTLIPGSGRSPGEGNVNPLQYSCLENPKDRGAWQRVGQELFKYLKSLKMNRSNSYTHKTNLGGSCDPLQALEGILFVLFCLSCCKTGS